MRSTACSFRRDFGACRTHIERFFCNARRPGCEFEPDPGASRPQPTGRQSILRIQEGPRPQGIGHPSARSHGSRPALGLRRAALCGLGSARRRCPGIEVAGVGHFGASACRLDDGLGGGQPSFSGPRCPQAQDSTPTTCARGAELLRELELGRCARRCQVRRLGG